MANDALVPYLNSLSNVSLPVRGYLDILLNMMGERQGTAPKDPVTLRTQEEPSGGFGDTPGAQKGTAESGKLSGGLATAANVASGIRQGAGLLGGLGLLGTMGPAVSMAMGPLAPLSMIGLASKVLGGAPEYDPAMNMPNIQDIADYFGYMASEEQAAKNQAAIDAFNAMVSYGIETPSGYSTGRTTPGGWGGASGPPSPSVGNPDIDTSAPGWGSNVSSQSDPGADPGGIGHSAGDTGEAGYARGGVSRVRKPTRALYGEAGPESAIFIPESMKRPGIQGREILVRNALRQFLRDLTQRGRGRR